MCVCVCVCLCVCVECVMNESIETYTLVEKIYFTKAAIFHVG